MDYEEIHYSVFSRINLFFPGSYKVGILPSTFLLAETQSRIEF